jgi:hypothetical protein
MLREEGVAPWAVTLQAQLPGSAESHVAHLGLGEVCSGMLALITVKWDFLSVTYATVTALFSEVVSSPEEKVPRR